MNRDILLELVTRFTDDTLLKMSTVPYWREQIRSLLQTRAHEFWHRRTEYIARMELHDRDADWKNIYYAVSARKRSEADPGNNWILRQLDEVTMELGLGDLEAFRVLLQVFGWPTISGYGIDRVWRSIRDPRVLSEAIQMGLLTPIERLEETALISVASLGVKEMIDPLLSLSPDPEHKKKMEEYVLRNAGGSRQTEIVEMMLARIADKKAIGEALYLQARYHGDEATIRLLLSRVSSPEVIKSATDQAVRGDNLSALRVLMRVLNPGSDAKYDLFLVAYEARTEDAMLHILGQLDTHAMSSVIVYLQSRLGSRIEKMQSIRLRLRADPLSMGQLEDLLRSPTTEYDRLLCHIILTRPSDIELLDWMIAQNSEAFELASRSALNNAMKLNSDITPIACFLAMLLYPSLTLRAVMGHLLESGVDRDLVMRSAQLIATQVGVERLA